MASRAELVQICQELEIDCSEQSIEEMKKLIKEEADRRFDKKYWTGSDDYSDTLLRFITKEYDYILVDKNNKQVEI